MFRATSILVAALLLVGGPLQAAPGADDPAQSARESARRAFADGERAFAGGEYEGALEHFRQAWQTLPHVQVQFNIAACLERLGRFDEAARAYDEVAGSNDALPD